ncbi:MAG: tryptophan synthase subunit alpha [gamma proteobacterium symbiont of Lucinoma myriamae]|nr:tryptophan synthase subunit alpha [gamma proteobacterium symbiont of Lucinoma myriamae]MCU7819002.1 tryptophan synthase subunit alpha [gamma proteobacterium symbiont of Lucinoma myriamae]MCU7831782.1 tryptophan synthase subunit alpha [gamma proteobacterium symbiont of Lucinoma myriamae]
MSRIKGCFAQLKKNNKKALIPYVAAGDPNPEITMDLMHAMVESGADIIELGVPFSDPMADGPVIQKASERALIYGTSLTDVLAIVKSFRATNNITPVVLMGYLNPIEVMGYETFAKAANDAGVDGVLTVDIPPEEAGTYIPALREFELDPIFLLSPTTTKERMQLICQYASGFVYYVSVKGVTGTSALDTDEVAKRLAIIKEVTDLPVGVGFGIKSAETAAAVGKAAEAVVVGSALVNLVEKNAHSLSQDEGNKKTIKDISQVLSSMRSALDA